MENQRIIVPEMDLTAIISESRDAAKALNEFANDLERIDKKYAKWQLRENEESLCDSCEYGDCWLRQQYGEARNFCKHYKKKSEENE